MDARELRIGNWITNGLSDYQVNADIIYDIAVYIAEFYPIPLTEERLLKLGFAKHFQLPGLYDGLNKKLPYCNYKHLNVKNNRETWVYSIKENLIYIFTDYTSRRGGHLKLSRIVKIHYVHQIQNLYRTLTNKELL